MTRLHAEIMRSISHYRAQQQGAAPERAYLCGGSSSMPYMREFFQEKLQMPIEFFNPLRNVSVANASRANDASHAAHLLGELVGLALRATAACPMELNLRPAGVVRRQDLEKRRPYFVVAAACLVLALLGWGFYFTRAAYATDHATERLQEKIDMMRGQEAALDGLKKKAAALDRVASPLIDSINDRGYWLRVLEDLNSRLPKEDIWITELIPTSGGKPVGVSEKRISEIAQNAGATPTPAPPSGGRPVVPNKPAAPVIDGLFVRGLYLSNPKQQEVVVDYFRNLLGSPYFVIDPNNQARVIRPTTPNNTEWAFPYELHLDLKKPLALP
jgi:hypothetical protein